MKTRWNLINRQATWTPRDSAGAVVFQDLLCLLGGGIYHDRGANHSDAWWSTDRAEWQLTDRRAPWGVRHETACLTFGGKAWLLGGFSGALAGSTVYNDIWTMEAEG